MPNHTAPKTASDTHPVDVVTMRATICRLLPPDESPAPEGAELEALTLLLRGHLELLIPEVEAAASRMPSNDIPRYCALACLGEARQRLRESPSPVPGGAIAHARRLARALHAVCDHYEALTGVAMCLVCDQPIRSGDDSLPYDHGSRAGGAAGAGRIHARCKGTRRR